MLNVGQGIRDRMSENNDYPVEDAAFSTNSDGTKLERCLGLKGLYIASDASGNWAASGPLPVAL